MASQQPSINVDFQDILTELRARIGEETVNSAINRAALNRANEDNARLQAENEQLKASVADLNATLTELKTVDSSPDLGRF